MDCMNYLDKLKNSNGYKLVIHGQIDYMKYKIWKFARILNIYPLIKERKRERESESESEREREREREK